VDTRREKGVGGGGRVNGAYGMLRSGKVDQEEKQKKSGGEGKPLNTLNNTTTSIWTWDHVGKRGLVIRYCSTGRQVKPKGQKRTKFYSCTCKRPSGW